MQKYYRFLHDDDLVRKNSSSGGAFTAISDQILAKGGVVYGCIMDENLTPKHSRATNKEERDKMRGSKYIQSDTKEIFQQIERDLKAEKIVLFTGTPCQSFALLNYLALSRICTDKLITMELVCHGVGSKTFFTDYIHNLEIKYRGKAIKVNFRAKHHKGQKQDMEVVFDNKKKYNASSTRYDWFYSVYLKNLILRPSCYECPFAQKKRFSDLTVADHWGYQDEKAYSLIVSNTPSGNQIMKQIMAGCECEVDEISEHEIRQPHMEHPCAKPNQREMFWNIYQKYGYLDIQKWIGNNSFSGRMKGLLARVAYETHVDEVIKHIHRRRKKSNETGK